MNVLDYNGTGGFNHRQTVSLVPACTDKSNSIGADIQILPDGGYVYASVRGLDTLSVLKVESDGSLSLKETFPSRGKTPRNFAVTPDGKYLLAANQDTDNLVVFAINPISGGLSEVFEVCIPTPVCVKTYFVVF